MESQNMLGIIEKVILHTYTLSQLKRQNLFLLTCLCFYSTTKGTRSHLFLLKILNIRSRIKSFASESKFQISSISYTHINSTLPKTTSIDYINSMPLRFTFSYIAGAQVKRHSKKVTDRLNINVEYTIVSYLSTA